MKLTTIHRKANRPVFEGVGEYIIVIALLITAIAPRVVAANLNPVQWRLSADASEVPPGAKFLLRLDAEVAPGFHLYSLTTPRGGPIRTTIQLVENPIVQQSSVFQPRPQRRDDPTFGIPVELFSGSTIFLIPVTLKSGTAVGSRTLTARVRYQACSNEVCLPPADREAVMTIVVKAGVRTKSVALPKSYQRVSGAVERELE